MTFLSRVPFLLIFTDFVVSQITKDCFQHFQDRDGQRHITCLCHENYCDTIEKVGDLNTENQAIIYTTTKAGLRMKRTSANFDAIQENHSPVLTVFPTELRQKMKGFGGTFTDAAVWNIDNLPERARKHLLESYFGVDGIEYSFGRVPIGSNDFSTRPYSYNDWSGDVNLSNFSLADEDLEHRIPILREALSLRNGSLKLLATPWTAPFWMKSNGRAQGAGVLLHEVDRIDMWKVYALYLLRYFEEFAKRGIHFYAVSAQNEPNLSRSAHFPWQAMYFSPQMLTEFVSKYLGPAIKSNKITKDLHIFPLEISREQLELYSQEICGNEKAFNYSSGIGIHWYADTKIGTNILRNVVTEWATKYVLYTESANGWLTNDVLLGDWNRAEKYVESMMETVNNGVTGWIDYNLCVDTSGGPSWIGNNLDAAIVVDKHNKSFMKQPMFYAIGHFSKFIGENADYMASEFSRKGIGVSDISHSAFVNPDRSRALILYNKNSSYSWNISVVDDATPFSQLILTLPPKSIVTVLWNKITFTSKLKEPQKDLQSQPFGESEITTILYEEESSNSTGNFSKIARRPEIVTTTPKSQNQIFSITLIGPFFLFIFLQF